MVAGSYRWCQPFVERLMRRFPGPLRPRAIAIESFIREDQGLRRTRFGLLPANFNVLPEYEMYSALPTPPEVLALSSVLQISKWLGISSSQLDGFADLRGFTGRCPHELVRNYRYRILAKRYGAIRLIESPKPRLKAIQRKILHEILDRVPAHEAAHGFRRGRSIRSFAALHIGTAVVVRMDLADFFPCITRARVRAMFRAIGYPESIADLLSGLCTTVTPGDVWRSAEHASRESLNLARRLFEVPHLPQGAPTSPAIANLCAYRLDCRLTGLANSVAASYTRYADDLVFSGDDAFACRAKRFSVHVAATVAEEGLKVHHRKTRIMRDGVRQHIAGVVVNRRLNVRRTDFDRLKAILVNCRRSGPDSQNWNSHTDFRAHLLGRIAFVTQLNPARGKKLKDVFDSIKW